MPILGEILGGGGFRVLGARAVVLSWPLESGGRLMLEANWSNSAVIGFGHAIEDGLWEEGAARDGELSPWSVRWSLTSKGSG
jgi:hypothetical protein